MVSVVPTYQITELLNRSRALIFCVSIGSKCQKEVERFGKKMKNLMLLNKDYIYGKLTSGKFLLFFYASHKPFIK